MRIAIVNDLPMAVEALRRAIAARPEHQIAWVAFDGAQAVAACARDTPDLILMDLVMPVMDGIEATRQIMTRSPCAILIVTVDVGANADRVFEAMGCGALDAVDTPPLGSRNAESATILLSKIESIGKLITEKQTASSVDAVDYGVQPVSRESRLVAIGASAGGPAALATLLAGLPADFSASIVIVQHVDEQFAIGMADWLSAYSKLPVRAAREGDRPDNGQVLLAATGNHLVLKPSGRLGYTSEPLDYAYRPSVDVFFHSVCHFWSFEAVGVQLTGMGRDGALGLKALRDKGCHTIAQDQASSAVYGMPKAAVALDAAVEVLALDRIAPRLASIFGRSMQMTHMGGRR